MIKLREEYKNEASIRFYKAGLPNKNLWGPGGYTQKELALLKEKSRWLFDKYFEEKKEPSSKAGGSS